MKRTLEEIPALEGGQPIRSEALPFHRATLGQAEEQAVLEVLRTGWLTRGPKTALLEERLREYTGAAFALGLNSCTAALELTLNLAGVGSGDEVITTALTFTATANVIIHRGSRPVLVDVEPDTLNISPDAVAAAVTERTRAVIAVDLAGHPAEYDALQAIAEKHHLTLIADAAHSLEGRYRGRAVGTLAPFTCLSFYANKNMTTGEGGALLMRNSSDLEEQAAVLSLHGMSRHAWNRYGSGGFKHYDVTAAGHKWNMFDIQGALGLAQMDRLELALARRHEIVELYRRRLADQPELELPVVRPYVRTAHHLFMVRLRPKTLRVDRDRILDGLKAEGIGVAVHYRALPQFTFYRETVGARPEETPVAVDAADRLISLPLFPDMTDADVDDVVSALGRLLSYYRR